MRLSIIVPVYNEIATIEEILRRVRAQVIDDVQFEVVVIDDGSTDGTRQLLDKNPSLYDVFLKNPRNLGKGGAVKEGLTAATGDYVLFQDADLEYDPSEYSKLLTPVTRFRADVVMGSRFLAPAWTRIFYFRHKVGNLVITTWFNLLYNTTWTDVYSCYLLFRRDLVMSQKLRTTGWEQHAEILALSCLRGERLYEVPISYNGRSYDEGKKIQWYHFFRIFLTMVRVRVFRRRGKR